MALPLAGAPKGMSAVTETDALLLPLSLLFPDLVSFTVWTDWPEAKERPDALPRVAPPSFATSEAPSILVLAVIATCR